MYNLPYFKEEDPQLILDFIRKHPFAFLAGCDENAKPVATQVPVFVEEKDNRFYLTGHMMRSTDHHKAFEKNHAVLCVFSGAHAYVSATWYGNPHQASTWNYMSVHAKGVLRFLDEAGLVEVLRKTSLHFEGYDKSSTTTYDNLPAEYTSKLLKAIVAFEIEVEEMDNVFKLSQNRDEKSYSNIMERLTSQGGDSEKIAEEMTRRKASLYHR